MPQFQIQYKQTAQSEWINGPLVDTGESLQGQGTVTGLTNGIDYDFRVVRLTVTSPVVTARPVADAEIVSGFVNTGGTASSGSSVFQIGRYTSPDLTTYVNVPGVLIAYGSASLGVNLEYQAVDGGSYTQFGLKEGVSTFTRIPTATPGAIKLGTKSGFFPFPVAPFSYFRIRVTFGGSTVLAIPPIVA